MKTFKELINRSVPLDDVPTSTQTYTYKDPRGSKERTSFISGLTETLANSSERVSRTVTFPRSRSQVSLTRLPDRSEIVIVVANNRAIGNAMLCISIKF